MSGSCRPFGVFPVQPTHCSQMVMLPPVTDKPEAGLGHEAVFVGIVVPSAPIADPGNNRGMPTR